MKNNTLPNTVWKKATAHRVIHRRIFVGPIILQFLPRLKQASAWQVSKESKAPNPVEFAQENAVRRSNCKAADKAGIRRAGMKMEAGKAAVLPDFFANFTVVASRHVLWNISLFN